MNTVTNDRAESVSSRRQFLAAGLTLAAGAAVAPQPAAEKIPNLGDEIYPGAVQDGINVLPPLPYDYNALEPQIDEVTLRLHHDKHHKAYVDGFNANLQVLIEMRESGKFENLEHVEQKAAFNGAGHHLHCLYWATMAPEAARGGMSVKFAHRIEVDFGSRGAFEAQLRAAALTTEGSGWALLVWSYPVRKLGILQARNHQYNTIWSEIPLMVVDVWEHAYYKKYSNDRAEYLKNFMQVIDWGGVSRRYDAVRSVLG
ncbi:superoxide dismutase [bacterium]|nr:superoxide dismutase [bacterium]